MHSCYNSTIPMKRKVARSVPVEVTHDCGSWSDSPLRETTLTLVNGVNDTTLAVWLTLTLNVGCWVDCCYRGGGVVVGSCCGAVVLWCKLSPSQMTRGPDDGPLRWLSKGY